MPSAYRFVGLRPPRNDGDTVFVLVIGMICVLIKAKSCPQITPISQIRVRVFWIEAQFSQCLGGFVRGFFCSELAKQ